LITFCKNIVFVKFPFLFCMPTQKAQNNYRKQMADHTLLADFSALCASIIASHANTSHDDRMPIANDAVPPTADYDMHKLASLPTKKHPHFFILRPADKRRVTVDLFFGSDAKQIEEKRQQRRSDLTEFVRLTTSGKKRPSPPFVHAPVTSPRQPPQPPAAPILPPVRLPSPPPMALVNVGLDTDSLESIIECTPTKRFRRAEEDDDEDEEEDQPIKQTGAPSPHIQQDPMDILAPDTPVPDAPAQSDVPEATMDVVPDDLPPMVEEEQPPQQGPEPEPYIIATDSVDKELFNLGLWNKPFERVMASKYYLEAVKPAVVKVMLPMLTDAAFRERLLDFCEAGKEHVDFCQATAFRHKPEAITCSCCGDISVSELRLECTQIRRKTSGHRPTPKKGDRRYFTWDVGVCCRHELVRVMYIYHLMYTISKPKGSFGYQGFDMMAVPDNIEFGNPRMDASDKAHMMFMCMLLEPQSIALPPLLYTEKKEK
jgi:hypothetical protein